MFSLQGRIKNKMPEITGTSRSGNAYRIGCAIIEYSTENSNATHTVAMKINGDLNDVITIGKEYQISFVIGSREYNSKWYTDAVIEKVMEVQQEGRMAEIEAILDNDDFASEFIPGQQKNDNSSDANQFMDTKDDLPF